MKVILLQDVAKIGRRSEIVNVPDGYAMNQLIPKKMAEPATPANVKRIEKATADKAASADADSEAFMAAVAAIKATPVSVAVEANEQGHLFKAVSAEEVVTAAKGVGAVLSPDMVSFANPIKELGDHSVDLKQGDNTATITISVTAK